MSCRSYAASCSCTSRKKSGSWIRCFGARSDTSSPVIECGMAYDTELANRIRTLIGNEPGLTEKAMFGGLAFLVNGNMSVSASSKGGLLLRVEPAQTMALAKKPHAQPFEMH